VVRGLKLNNRLILGTAALGLMMIASNITSLNEMSFAPSVLPEIMAPKEITAEEYVRNYFSDIPIMVEIAKCESHFRQHGSGGEALHGEKNYLDRGVMQINEYFHSEDSDKLGYDILTIEGNTAYARYLFEKYGVKPWKPSFGCWGRTAAYSQYRDLAIK
jgi:hypothetical protein